jgi:hypothetical protein
LILRMQTCRIITIMSMVMIIVMLIENILK